MNKIAFLEGYMEKNAGFWSGVKDIATAAQFRKGREVAAAAGKDIEDILKGLNKEQRAAKLAKPDAKLAKLLEASDDARADQWAGGLKTGLAYSGALGTGSYLMS